MFIHKLAGIDHGLSRLVADDVRLTQKQTGNPNHQNKKIEGMEIRFPLPSYVFSGHHSWFTDELKNQLKKTFGFCNGLEQLHQDEAGIEP